MRRVEKGRHADSHWSYIQQPPGEKQHVYELTLPCIRVRGYGYRKTDFFEGAVIFTIEQPRESYCCSACGSKDVIGRGQSVRRFRTVPIGGKPVYLVFAVPRVECRQCEVVRQVKIAFADPRVTYPKPFSGMPWNFCGT